MHTMRGNIWMKNYLLRRYFRIPYRTLEDWERGVRHIAEYLLRLMIYRLEMEGLARGLSEKMPD